MHKELKSYFILLITVFVLLTGAALIYRKATEIKEFDFEKELELTEKPERIVSLAPNITDILLKLELLDQIVAVSSDEVNSPLVKNKKTVGTFWKPNLEAVIAAKPDLVITLDFEQQMQVARSLKKMGYPVLCLKLEKIEDLFSTIEKIGKATKTDAKAQQIIDYIQTRLDRFKQRFASAKKQKVLWVVQQQPLRIAGTDTFINQLIELAGAVNAVGQTIQKYPSLNAEQIMSCSPDVIIHSAMEKQNIEKQQRDAEEFWSKWQNIPAVKNNRIFVMDANEVARLSPDLPQGIRLINRTINIKNKNGNKKRRVPIE